MSLRLTDCVHGCTTVVCNGCGVTLGGSRHCLPGEVSTELGLFGWSEDSDGHSCPKCIAESGVTS